VSSSEDRPEFDPLEFDDQPSEESPVDDLENMPEKSPEGAPEEPVDAPPSEEVLGDEEDLSALMAGGGSVSQASHLTFEEVAGQDEAVSGVESEEAAIASGVGQFDTAGIETEAEAAFDESAYPSEEEDEDWLKKPSIWKRIAETSPFTVFLGVSLLALLIAIFCLWMELRHYNFDIDAQEANQALRMTPTDHPGLPSTTPTA